MGLVKDSGNLGIHDIALSLNLFHLAGKLFLLLVGLFLENIHQQGRSLGNQSALLLEKRKENLSSASSAKNVERHN